MTWQERSICKGDLRFTSLDPRDQEEALAICARCPVVAECREWAEGEDFEGVAGAMLWRSKGKPGNRSRIPAAVKFAHWSEDEMRRARSRWTCGDRSQWACEGNLAYGAWRRRLSRERAA